MVQETRKHYSKSRQKGIIIQGPSVFWGPCINTLNLSTLQELQFLLKKRGNVSIKPKFKKFQQQLEIIIIVSVNK
jgi:hypothetical protein